MKNISALWVVDKEELKKEKMEDMAGIIKIKKLYSNTMDSSVIGVYSLRMSPLIDPINNHYQRLNEVEKQKITLLTATNDGYLRLF
jgi:hypothetical protein